MPSYRLDETYILNVNGETCEFMRVTSPDDKSEGKLSKENVDTQYSDIVVRYCKEHFPEAKGKHLWLSTELPTYKFDRLKITIDLTNKHYEMIQFGSGCPVISYDYGSLTEL